MQNILESRQSQKYMFNNWIFFLPHRDSQTSHCITKTTTFSTWFQFIEMSYLLLLSLSRVYFYNQVKKSYVNY